MKAIFKKTTSIILLIITLVGCSDKMGNTDKRLSQVPALIEPVDGKTIVLEPSVNASLYFEWDYINELESGTAIYQIAFDKLDGDFTKPVYTMFANNNGYKNNVSITHKQMNKIASLMGFLPSATGTFKWTVFSTKGMHSLKSSQENKITVTRMAGFENIPLDVYVTGEGAEGGTELSKSHKMKAIATGEFEIYTNLKANKPFYFTDKNSEESKAFYTENGLIKEDGTTTVSTDGVYKIILDFNTGACTYTLITRISLFFCPDNTYLFDFQYLGYGVFKATQQKVTFKQESWGRDERYKFRMFIKENAGNDSETELEWGTLHETDSQPTSSSPESYYYLKLFPEFSQWSNKWKLKGEFDDVPADYTIYLTADQPYTHSISK